MAEKQEKGIVKYMTQNGEIKLSLDIINKYLVSGGGKLTEQEGVMFMALCSMQKLNPFLREVYPIKYGNNPFQAVTGIEAFRKRAFDNPKHKGHNSFIVKWDDGEKIAGCKVFVEGFAEPVYVEVDFNEYVARKHDGTINKMWTEKPRTMLKKVAESQALRVAFPKEYGGMYTAEEINNIDMEKLPKDAVNAEFTVINEEPASPSAGAESNTGEEAPVASSESKEIPGIDKYQLSSLLALMKDMPEEARRKWLDKYQTGDPATLTAKQAKELIGDLNAEKRK